jgi:hypothetical protein
LFEEPEESEEQFVQTKDVEWKQQADINSVLSVCELTPSIHAEQVERIMALKKVWETFLTNAELLTGCDSQLFDLLCNQRLTVDEAADKMRVSRSSVRIRWSNMIRLSESVRIELKGAPLCMESLPTEMQSEQVFRETLWALMKLVIRVGFQDVERTLNSAV